MPVDILVRCSTSQDSCSCAQTDISRGNIARGDIARGDIVELHGVQGAIGRGDIAFQAISVKANGIRGVICRDDIAREKYYSIQYRLMEYRLE